MRHIHSDKLVRVSCWLALAALPLMVWSVFDPRVWPVLIALSMGQAIGTMSLALFLYVVVRDLGVKKKLDRDAPPPSSLRRLPDSGED